MRVLRPMALAGLAMVLALACSGGGSSDGDVTPDGTTADVAADVGTDPGTPDVVEATDAPGEAEVADPDLLPPLTEPVVLRAGFATVQVPIPVGIPISGFGPANGCKMGPYAKNYPANDIEYTAPTWKVLALEGGTGRMVFLKGDLVGIDSYTRQDVVERLKARTGQDFSNTFVFGATHTHSGPARMSKNPMFQFVQDQFFPEHYERVVESIVSAVLEAFHDLEPVTMGYGLADGKGISNDRRCEDPEYDESHVQVMSFRRTSDDSLKGLLTVFAVHGTVIGNDNCTISQDVAGGLERKLEERFDRHVPVVFLNAWAGDKSPGDNPVDETGSPVKHTYTRIESLGNLFADRVLASLDALKTQSGVLEVSGRTVWVPLSREALGYQQGEFPFPFGGLYCGGAKESVCWDDPGGQVPLANLDKGCVPLTEDKSAPDRTLLTAARIGDLHLITFPGEPVTPIYQAIRDAILAAHPGLDLFFVGYAQDYVGYSTPEWDWWLGGYEPSGAMWGPKQGDYLTERAIAIMESFLNPATPLSWEEPAPPAITPSGAGTFTATRSTTVGTWSVPPQASYGPNEQVEVVFEGGDNWYGVPRVELQKKDGDAWTTVLHKNGSPVVTGSYEFENEIVMEPTYTDNREAAARAFHWYVRFATTRPASSTTEPLVGTFRFHAAGTARTDAGEAPYETDSAAFEITE